MTGIRRIGTVLLLTLFLLCIPMHLTDSAQQTHVHTAHSYSNTTQLFEHFHEMTNATQMAGDALTYVLGIAILILGWFFQYAIRIVSHIRASSQVVYFDTGGILRRWLRLHFTSPPQYR